MLELLLIIILSPIIIPAVMIIEDANAQTRRSKRRQGK